MLSLQGARVRSLVGAPGSRVPCGVAREKKILTLQFEILLGPWAISLASLSLSFLDYLTGDDDLELIVVMRWHNDDLTVGRIE